MELYDIFVPSGGEFNNNHTSLPFMMDEAALWNDDADSFEPIIMNDDDPEHGLNVTSFLASPSHESSLISLPFSSMSGSSSDDVTDTYSTNHLKRKPTEEPEPQQPAEKKQRQREQEATKGKMKRTRRRRGTVTEPQRVYAKRRREKLNEKLKTLQNLVPNGTMVDVSTMLDLAFKYVKFMQLQIKLLSSDEHWMYAPVAFNGCPPEKDLM